MRLKLTILYCFLFLFILLAGYFLFFSLPEPSPEVEEEPLEYQSAREEILLEEDTPASFDFSALKEQNEDFICWLNIPDTTISYPVVLGKDNSYYLTHSFSGAESGFGCLFADTRTPVGGDVLMIHGHNMGYNRTEMFSLLVQMQDPSYAAEHNKIHLSFPDSQGEKEYVIFAVGNFTVTDESFDLYQSQFATEEEREAYLSHLLVRSLYAGYQPAEEGDILILSTCNNLYGEDNRLLICAVEGASQE